MEREGGRSKVANIIAFSSARQKLVDPMYAVA